MTSLQPYSLCLSTGTWCKSSISECEPDGSGANPGFLTNFQIRREDEIVVAQSKEESLCTKENPILRNRLRYSTPCFEPYTFNLQP